MCLDNELAHLNPLPHTEHRFGLPTTLRNSPVCFFLCFVRFELSANDILHTEHTCGLFGLCIFKCRFSILFSANRLWQNSHANFKFFMSSDGGGGFSSAEICDSF